MPDPAHHDRTCRSIRSALNRVWPPVLALVVVVAAWQAEAMHDRYVLPRPWSVLSQLVDHPGLYLHAGRVTLLEALAGLAIGFGLAVVLAVIMVSIAVIDRAVYPLAVLVNVTPVVALAPALVVAFGFGSAPKIVLTAVICFFPALINALAGLRRADPAVVEVLESLDASRLEILIRVRLPGCLPFLFAAGRVCLPLSVTGAVVAELVAPGSTAGLGTLILQAANASQLARVYAAIVCLGVLGVVLTLGVGLAERRVLSWHASVRTGT